MGPGFGALYQLMDQYFGNKRRLSPSTVGLDDQGRFGAVEASTTPSANLSSLSGFASYILTLLISIALFLWEYVVEPLAMKVFLIAILLWPYFVNSIAQITCQAGQAAKRSIAFTKKITKEIFVPEPGQTFRDKMFEHYRTLRYNWYTDQIMLFHQKFDRICRMILDNPPLVFILALWLFLGLKVYERRVDRVVRVDWDNLPPGIAGKEPYWVHVPRNYVHSRQEEHRMMAEHFNKISTRHDGVSMKPITGSDTVTGMETGD